MMAAVVSSNPRSPGCIEGVVEVGKAHLYKLLVGRQIVGDAAHVRAEALESALREGVEDLLLAREVPVEGRRVAEAGAPGQIVEVDGVDAALRDDLGRRVEDLVAGAGAHGRASAGARHVESSEGAPAFTAWPSMWMRGSHSSQRGSHQ